MSCEVRKLPNFSKKPDVFFSFHLWFHSRWLFLSNANAVPCFSLGGKHYNVSSKEVVSFPTVVLFSRPSSAWHSHRGMHPRPTHRPSFSAWKKDRFPQDGAATCMILVRTSDIYRNARGTVDDIYMYICVCVYWYLHDSMTHTFQPAIPQQIFTKLWLWHVSSSWNWLSFVWAIVSHQSITPHAFFHCPVVEQIETLWNADVADDLHPVKGGQCWGYGYVSASLLGCRCSGLVVDLPSEPDAWPDDR